MEHHTPAQGGREREGIEERFVRFVLWGGEALAPPCFTGSLSDLQTNSPGYTLASLRLVNLLLVLVSSNTVSLC